MYNKVMKLSNYDPSNEPLEKILEECIIKIVTFVRRGEKNPFLGLQDCLDVMDVFIQCVEDLQQIWNTFSEYIHISRSNNDVFLDANIPETDKTVLTALVKGLGEKLKNIRV